LSKQSIEHLVLLSTNFPSSLLGGSWKTERTKRMTKQELDEIRRRAATQHPFDFFAYAKEDIPKLLDEVERLQGTVADLEDLLDKDGYPRV
jgi:hypothetical protein